MTFIEKHYSLLLILRSYVNNYHHKSYFNSSKLCNQLDSKDSFEPLNIEFLFTILSYFRKLYTFAEITFSMSVSSPGKTPSGTKLLRRDSTVLIQCPTRNPDILAESEEDSQTWQGKETVPPLCHVFCSGVRVLYGNH